jgi:hypothetical protein
MCEWGDIFCAPAVRGLVSRPGLLAAGSYAEIRKMRTVMGKIEVRLFVFGAGKPLKLAT